VPVLHCVRYVGGLNEAGRCHGEERDKESLDARNNEAVDR
jgi:hypothetical protein